MDVAKGFCDSDSEDEDSHQGGTGTPQSRSHRRSKKLAYVVFTGRKTGVFTEWFVIASFSYFYFQPVRSSAESQVKFFPGSSYKGYTNVDSAIAAWDRAVANNVVGVPRVYSNPILVSPPTTPSRQRANLANPTPMVHPTTPPRHTLSTPVRSKPSAQGSETRLAAIIAALNEVELSGHYVVVRGEKPGVYSNRCVSSFLDNTFFLIFKISTSACTALGISQSSLCYFVTSKEAADAKYVEKSMAGKVAYL